MRNKLRKLFVLIGCLTLLLMSLWACLAPPQVNRVYLVDSCARPNQTHKTILYWNPMFSRSDMYMGMGRAPFEGCPVKNCFATDNPGCLPVDEYDAIIFHAPEFHTLSSWRQYSNPLRRSPKQVYIFLALESPVNMALVFYQNDFYNWTMTYRSDSDLVRRYGVVLGGSSNYTVPSKAEIAKRPKMIAWMVSNCETQSRREDLYKEIVKYIDVDVFGKCGALECPKENATRCFEMIQDNYKFYLAFENSYCEDYVTEKLYNVLNWNVVPIVFGGANYTKDAPPMSVINVADFSSIRDLVEYIQFLDRHPEEYLKYFLWKRKFVIERSPQGTVCDLCQKLNEAKSSKSYKDIAQWWTKEKCTDARKLY